MPSEKELAIRRERVKALVLAGYDAKGVAEKLDMNVKTVYRDLRCLNTQAVLEKDEKIVEIVFQNYVNNINWLIDQALTMHAENPDGRMDALRFVADEHEKMIDRAQNLGLLDKSANKVEVKSNLSSDMEQLAKEFADSLAVNNDDEQGTDSE